MIVPPPIAPGRTIAVVAPSSPFEHALAWRGLAVLRARYELRFRRDMFSRQGYLAGSDARRFDELAEALVAPDVVAIVAARGGVGAGRFAHRLPWDALVRHPKWIVGFSDITALHVEASRVGVASLHASHVTMLGRGDAHHRARFVASLEAPLARRTFDDLGTVVPGEARGLAWGGNLTLLHACAVAGRLLMPEGAIVFLEDVTERPYRLERMLTSLVVGGHLARAGAIVLGEFFGCGPGPDGVVAHDAIVRGLEGLACPIVSGFPFGHGDRNEAIALGGPASLVATAQGAQVVLGA